MASMRSSGQCRIDRNRGLSHLRWQPSLAERSFRRHATEHRPMATPAEAGALAPTRQPIPAPLTRARDISGRDGQPRRLTPSRACNPCAPTSPRCFVPSGFASPAKISPASWDLGPRRGTGSLVSRGRPNCNPFREFRAASRHAVATPGDLLFHIRAERMDLCFELATHIMARLEGRRCCGGRGARLSLFRQPRPLGLWSTGPRTPPARRSGGRHDNRRGGPPPSLAAAMSSCRNISTT